jgi:hypothetical protein
MSFFPGLPLTKEMFDLTRLSEPSKLKRKMRDPVDRFLEKVAPSASGCFEWQGSKTPDGYGWFSWNHRATLAHRWSYEAVRARIPEGMVIDHLCRNTCCVNPLHLECVSMGENTRRGILHDVQRAAAKQRTHCQRGHPFFGPNLGVSSTGTRMCRECRAIAGREWKANNRDRTNEQQRARRAGER